MRTVMRTFAAAAAVTLIAGCNGRDDQTFDDTAPATAPAPAPEPAPPPPTMGPGTAPYDTLGQDTILPGTGTVPPTGTEGTTGY